MKKKILIMTLFGNFNYGNKFQNYAMQEVLKKYNLDVYTLNTQRFWGSVAKNVSIIKRIINITPKKIFEKVKVWLNKKVNMKRQMAFEKFSDKYIKTVEYISDIKLKDEFDLVCIGSDQIWKPEIKNFYYAYAQFQDSNKVFSYAPSFGISEVADEHVNEVKKGLENVNMISVREEKGAEIIKKLINKDVDVLVDPTMLLTTDEWDRVVKTPEKLPKKEFIMTYFLGNYSKERRKYIKAFAKKNDLEIVDLGQVALKKYYATDPSEFLYFVKNAKIIFTDSFHGAVFSILYKKPFYTLKREDMHTSMSSRIETLLNKFELQERMLEDYNCQASFEINFENIDNLLEKERNKSKDFLKKALNVEENRFEG